MKAQFDNLQKKLSRDLLDERKYKVFYWAPDYSFCGFATSGQVENTAKKWLRDKKLRISERAGGIDKDQGKETNALLSNVSPIPELTKILKKSEMSY